MKRVLSISGAVGASIAMFAVAATGAHKACKAPTLSVASINQMIRAEWKKANIAPAAPVDDARYFRRIYIDITGTIPASEDVQAFLADKSIDKRARAVDQLLASPKYADQWMNYWDLVLMGRTVKSQVLDRVAFKQWLKKQFAHNAPWNKFVYDLVTAEGVNSTGGNYGKNAGIVMARKPGQGRQMVMDANSPGLVEDGAVTAEGKVNGATNWVLKYINTPADLSGNASKIFLGVQIQCAQCHDHKTEKWKQDDFRKLTACFMNARPKPVGTYEKGTIRRVDLEDMNRPFNRPNAKKAASRSEYADITPTALDGTDFSGSSNRRVALASWMTAPENPYFAQAFVNRMWSHFLGRGFVEPIDDFRPSNPATMPDLLKKLAEDFMQHDYDVKYLIRQITSTEAYQLSSGIAKTGDSENKLWARYRLKPVGPEQLLDSLITATGIGPVLEKVSGGNLEAVRFGIMRQLVFLFDVDEEFEQKDFEGTIPQALLLLNSNLTNKSVTPIPGTALAEILQANTTDPQKIEALYLRTVSRKPTSMEISRWTAFLNEPRDTILDNSSAPSTPTETARERRQMFSKTAKAMKKGFGKGNSGPDPLARLSIKGMSNSASPKEQAYEDIFWALLNSSEFVFNH